MKRHVFGLALACTMLVAPPGARTAGGQVSALVFIDQSESMRGFAREVSGLLDDFEQAIADVREYGPVRPDAVRFFGVGPTIEPIPDMGVVALGKSEGYNQPAADLAAVFAKIRAEAAPIALLLTDGQPSPKNSLTGRCSPNTRPDMSTLAAPLGAMIESGFGIWVWLDRLPFDGQIFLNCGELSSHQQANTVAKVFCPPGRECFARYGGGGKTRTVVAVLVSRPGEEAAAKSFIDALRRSHQASVAIALNEEPPPPRLEPVRILTSDTSTRVKPDGNGQRILVRCNEQESTQRRKVRAF